MAYPMVHTMANDTYNKAKFQDGQVYMVRRKTGVVAHNSIPQVLPYGSTMQANNISCVGGNTCIPVAEIQQPFMDYSMHQPWTRYLDVDS